MCDLIFSVKKNDQRVEKRGTGDSFGVIEEKIEKLLKICRKRKIEKGI